MSLFGGLNILVLMTIFRPISSSHSCPWYGTAVKKDVYMKGQVFYQIKLPSVYDCAAKCVMSSVCKSFNFDLKMKLCHLNTNTSDNVVIQSQSGFLFSDIHHWPTSVAGPCSTKPCLYRTKCDVTRLGKTVCSQEFPGCGDPPKISNSLVNSDGHFLNAEAVYICAINFRSCNQSDTWRLTCQQSGTWEGFHPSTCERYRWTDQAALFNESIPCGPTASLNLTWTGRHVQNSRFDVYFMTNSAFIFYIDIRFKYVVDEVLMVNTRNGDGTWGTERKLTTFPFTLNKVFSMNMVLRNGEYKVTVDGTHLITYPERWPGLKPERFVINGDITVNHVEFNV